MKRVCHGCNIVKRKTAGGFRTDGPVRRRIAVALVLVPKPRGSLAGNVCVDGLVCTFRIVAQAVVVAASVWTTVLTGAARSRSRKFRPLVALPICPGFSRFPAGRVRPADVLHDIYRESALV